MGMDIMDMDIMDTIRSILAANDGKIQGRTAIQKLVYLADKSIQGLEIPPYNAHYYGPYSPGVAQALGTLVGYSFIAETRVSGLGYIEYDYKLTDDGEEIVKKDIRINHEEKFDGIKEVVKRCKECCDLNINLLSYAAKIYYMLDKKGSMTMEEAVTIAKDLNWKISPDNAKKGAEILEKLELVSQK